MTTTSRRRSRPGARGGAGIAAARPASPPRRRRRGRRPPQVRPAPARQSPTPCRQRDKELEALRAEQRRALENEAKLKREIESIGDDRRKFNQQLIDTAARVVSIEERIAQTQERLKPLDESEEALRKSLEERRDVIAEVLAALQRIGRHAPPAILIRAEDALQSVRSAMMLGAVLPEMRHAGRSAGGRSRRARAAAPADRRGTRHASAATSLVLADDRQRLSLLIEERQKRQADAEKALADERQRAAQLARQADDLRELIAKLEQEPRNRRPRRPHGGARQRGSQGGRQPAGPRRAQGPRPADPGDRLRFRQGNAAAAGQRGAESGNSGPPTGSAAPKRGSRSPPGPAPRSRLRVTDGWFIPGPSAITANS